MRKFKSGACRDTDKGKIDYFKCLSPLMIKGLGDYLLKHNKLPDGSMRDFDNWKGLFGENHEEVCMASLSRHMLDMWLEYEGYESREGKREALYATLSNVMFIIHEFELKELEND